MIPTDEYEFGLIAEDVAKSRGQKVYYPEENQIQIDCDSKFQYEMVIDRLCEFDGHIDIDYTIDTIPSKTPGHCHITLTFKDRKFTETERMLWQAALGDDPMRVWLNFKRLLYGEKQPSRLFR